MQFSSAIQGFILSKQIEGLAQSTLIKYQRHLDHLNQYLENPLIEEITPNHIKQYFSYLQIDYKPIRWSNDDSPLSNRTLRNIWITLKSFSTWAKKDDLGLSDLMFNIPPPKFSVDAPDPFSKEEIKAILSTKGQKLSSLRNLAIILVLLDTGIRANELCMLSIGDYDPNIGRIEIKHGKGNKRRFVYLGAGSRKAIWRYLAMRSNSDDSALPLFSKLGEKYLNTRNLEKILERLGQKAGVKKVHPHRFRHTFAIEYLRGGGDIFTLQILLGHSSLEMVRHYSKFGAIDTQRVHARAGPVDNWLK